MSDEHERDEDEPAPPVTCCLLRRKILVGILQVLNEEQCGVGDSELADVLRFDLSSPDGKPVIAFRFCPWCGAPRDPGGETRIVSISPPEDEDDDEGPEF
ncbi:MAG: hypothetical protein AB7N76_11285 [Planctomycetota bacterium]